MKDNRAGKKLIHQFFPPQNFQRDYSTTYHASSDDKVSGTVNKCKHLCRVAGPLSVSIEQIQHF